MKNIYPRTALKNFLIFAAAWICVAAVMFFCNDPAHNDEGAMAGIILGVISFPLGLLIEILANKYFFYPQKDRAWMVFLRSAILYLAINYALIFLIKWSH